MKKIIKKVKNWTLKQLVKLKSLDKKKTLTITLVSLLVPLTSHALIGTGIFDAFSSALEGISELTLPLTTFFIFLALGLLFSAITLHISTWLLEIAANPANLEIMESEVVQIGWQFTSSVANTAIIIALIIIGIATILGRESYSAKKLLPKIIGVALLVNFSLVFVGIVVDIANIILMTFFKAGIGTELIEALAMSWDSLWTKLLAYLGGLSASFIVPFTAPVAQFTFIGSITTIFLPTIINTIIQIFVGFFIGTILLMYAGLFLARIFVIQIIAILSPLAFVAWALELKKIWKEWLDTLVEWAFMGAILFFFLLLSTIAVSPLRPDSSPTTILGGILDFGSAASLFMYYLMLGAFLIISVVLTKKFLPSGTQAIIGQVKSFATGLKDKAQNSSFTQPLTEDIKKRMRGRAAKGSTAQAIEDKQKRLDELKEKDSLKSTVKAGLQRANLTFSKYQRRSAMERGESPESKLEDLQGERKDVIKNASNEELKEMADKGIFESGETTGISLRGHEKNLPIEELLKRGELDDDVKEMAINNWDNLSKDVKDDITKKRPDIHVELADSTEEGLEDMIKEIEKMKPSETKDIDLDNISKAYKPTISSLIAKDGSAVKSWGESSKYKKQSLIDSLDGVSENTMEQFDEHVGKNIDKWSGLYETIEEKEENKKKEKKKKINNLENEIEKMRKEARKKDTEYMNSLGEEKENLRKELKKINEKINEKSEKLKKMKKKNNEND